MRPRRGGALLAVVLLAATAARAEEPETSPWPPRAEEPAPRPPRARLVLDGVVTAGAGATWLGLALAHSSLAATGCPCERTEVNAFDRVAVGWDFAAGEPAANVAAGLSLALPVAVLAAVAEDRRAWANDLLLVGEAVMVTGLLTQVAKTAVARPYPYMYGPAPYPEQNGRAENYASFWSGHAAVSMAAAVTLAYLFQRRRPHSRWRWVLWTVAPALALGAGALQMAAGNHFPTDLAVGAAVGATVGYAIPRLHEGR